MRLVVALLLALALAAPAAASERHPTLGELEHEVMCPTCKTLLELSHAPIAERMRVFIRGRIAAGETKSEIERQLVAQFGPGVLAEPPRSGLGLLAWLLPLVGLLGGVAVVAVVARHWRGAAAGESVPPLDAVAERRLERALAEFDS
jgi:cytochrome c-type biogenesis protein CcmH